MVEVSPATGCTESVGSYGYAGGTSSYGACRFTVEVTVAFATQWVLVIERLRRTEAPEVSYGNSRTPTGYQNQARVLSASAPRCDRCTSLGVLLRTQRIANRTQLVNKQSMKLSEIIVQMQNQTREMRKFSVVKLEVSPLPSGLLGAPGNPFRSFFRSQGAADI